MQSSLRIDSGGSTYTVDREMTHLVASKPVWTAGDTLFIRVLGAHKDARTRTVPLATFVYETMTMERLSSDKEIVFIDGNSRNLCFANLQAVPRRKAVSA